MEGWGRERTKKKREEKKGKGSESKIIGLQREKNGKRKKYKMVGPMQNSLISLAPYQFGIKEKW